jgi:molybdopterin molybdotransferase
MTKPLMLTAAQAREQLLAPAVSVSEVELVAMQAALGRILAEDVVSLVDVPPLDNTSMDGYAIRVADLAAHSGVLRVGQRIPAGSMGTELQRGTAARIFTGAPIPQGADAVVMQEDCNIDPIKPDAVSIATSPVVGQWIRNRGED